MSENALAERAITKFSEGYNCAQSVLGTAFEHWNGKSELVPKIATGFGGGIGRCGSVCGALTGGVMAIGVKYGTNKSSIEKRLKVYELSRKLYRQFELRHGSVNCRELIKYDLSNPKEFEEARAAKISEKKCHNFIKTVMEFLENLDTPYR